MSPHDALKTLGLNTAATPDEISQAYRDLVKIWHPDRFGADARLRAKAEEHLKSINAAYHALEASGFRTDASAAAPQAESAWQQKAAPQQPRSRDHVLRGWLYVASILLIVAMAGFALRAVGSRQSPSATAAVQQFSPAKAPVAAKISHRTPQLGGPATSGRPEFRVWSLSQADTDRVQLACASHAPQSDAYRGCIRAQLDALRRSRGAANLAGLSGDEREAAESACATTRDSGGESNYNLCLRQQVAAVAAEPIRPDLSTFNSADRSSVSAACSAASKRGAAQYDRCLVRFAKTLSDAQPSAETR